MYEFIEIDGVWRIQWGPSAKSRPKPTPPEKVVIVPFVQIETPQAESSKPEHITAA